MSNFLPNMYFNSIYDINYKKLKDLGINTLVYDFDNTIVEKGNYKVSKKLKDLFKKLSKDFNILILSNTFNEEKIGKFSKECKVSFVMRGLKPLRHGFKKILKISSCKSDDLCMIGDQLITDVYGGNKMHFTTVLVNGINNDELSITKFNRKLEGFIIKKLNKKYGFERNKFYD